MLGRKFARRLGKLPGRTSSERRGSVAVCALAFSLFASVSNCGFPEYGLPGAGSGGAGGTATAGGGVGGSAGGSAGGSVAGGDTDDAGASGASGGAAGVASGGAAGEAGFAGAPDGEPCPFPAPVTYPGHCFNRSVGDGETGTDCGGSDCAPCSSNQACTQNSDCLSQQCTSSKCVPLISLSYTPIEVSPQTRTPKFRLNFSYLDAASMPLRDLTIRYYYNHNSVTEPVIGLDSQATIDIGAMNMQVDISNKVLTSVHRFPLGPMQNGLSSDSYLEIAFNDSTTVTTNTKFVINQNIVAGSSDQPFDQNSHYSFMKAAAANEAITVYRAGQRLWGVEPPMALFPECAFALGVNMNGPALTVGGQSLIAESEAPFTFSGGATYANPTAKALPATDATTSSLLSTARTLNTGDSAVWSVPNGKYWAYTWLTSTVGSDSGTLLFGTGAADKFFGTMNTAGARWALLGPYPVEVVGRSLTLTVDGSVHVAGIELYQAQR
ncbi:MAG: hypothetical protein WDO74_13010 [Pseudomonadota bacterium]